MAGLVIRIGCSDKRPSLETASGTFMTFSLLPCQLMLTNVCGRHTGVYTNSYDAFLNVKNGFPVFSTALEANYVRKHEDTYAAFKLTDEDKADIHKLARDARIGVSRRHLPTQGRFCMHLAS